MSNLSEADLRPSTTTNNDAKAGQTAVKVAYEHFIGAVLSTVSASFCRKITATPLNYRTVLIPPKQTQNHDQEGFCVGDCPILGTFRTYLTTTGSLVVGLYFSACNSLMSLENVVAANLMPPNRAILAAPFGVLATKQGTPNGEMSVPDTALSQTPNTQALSFRGISDAQESAWKQTCLKALALCGLDVSAFKACSWVSLLVSRRLAQDGENEAKRSQATVPWPGPLCFRKKPIQVSATSRIGDTMLSGHEECHDPLGDARGWFNAAAERGDKISKRKAERATIALKEPPGPEVLVPKPNGLSPLALRRPSAAAAGVMYPTPPDAIQQHTGVAQSLDGTISSPGHPPPPPVTTIPDIDTTMTNTNQMSDTYIDSWEATNEPKRERSESNMLDSSDNMFGDMGEDMFGDNDITEDDFNFFDEQPGDDDLDVSMGDLHDSHLPPSTVQMPPPSQVQQPPQAVFLEPPPPPEPRQEVDDVVFTKPELKHARSSLNEVSSQRTRGHRTASTKRESSPFDPDTVFKRVRASMAPIFVDPNPTIHRHRRNSVFEKVDFDPRLPMINKKYQQGGAFDFSADPSMAKLKISHGFLPETTANGFLSQKFKELPLPTGSLVKTFIGIEGPTSHPSPTKPNGGYISDLDDSDIDSDRDDASSCSEAPPVSPVKSSVRRVNLDDDVLSQATSFRDAETIGEPEEQLSIELPRLSRPEPPEMPLYKFFSDPEPLTLDAGLSDEDLIHVAQTITEQAATGFLQIGAERKENEAASVVSSKAHELAIARLSLQALQNVIPSSLGAPSSTQLKGFLELQDIPLLGQPSRLQPRPIPGRDPNSEQFRANALYPIPGPHLEVRRSDTKLSVLPSATTFWESLGLAPSPGGKDIHALCVFPGWKGMADHVDTFLRRMKSVYESLKLGTFCNMVLSGDSADGLLPFEVDRISTSPDATVTGHGSALVESLEVLRSSLTEWTAKEKNLVIFFIYSPDNPGSIVEACAAFQRCFDMYRKILATRREKPQNELVVQLISSDFISSPTSLVVPPPSDFARLCLETYDRCTLFPGADAGPPTPAPAIVLEQPLPRMIDFKLTITPSASLLHENSCIHVAYAQSIDDRWVTAAWTNNRGHQQASASYCLARKGKPASTSMNDVAHEIWESTLELISIWKVHWRIIITKSGPMDQPEMDFWIDLARTESKANVTLSLATVDTNPSLQLIPPAIKMPSMTTSTFYSTPVSTPQASIVSPEQTNTPATPMRDNTLAATPGAESAPEAEGDAFLIDITDQTWGAVASHRLSNSTSLLEIRPALVSGYLIKRTGNRVEDPPVLMEVNIIHMEANPRAYEPLFRELLSQFRGLGTLARARGIVDREMDVRPWHIAAAEKGVRALYLLL